MPGMLRFVKELIKENRMTTITLEGKEYQLDIEQAEKLGLLKEKDNKVRSWEEFKEKYRYKYGYYYNENENDFLKSSSISMGEQLTPHEAKAIAAFSKLLKLRRDWIGDWNPDYCNSDERKYCIEVYQNKFYVTTVVNYSKPFHFRQRNWRRNF
jgi:hypothetical protein